MPEGSPERFGSSSATLIGWIKEMMQHKGTIVMSVCVGVYILAKTGLLADKKATTLAGA